MSLKCPLSDIVDLSMFVNDHMRSLVQISETDPRIGDWHHRTVEALDRRLPVQSCPNKRITQGLPYRLDSP